MSKYTRFAPLPNKYRPAIEAFVAEQKEQMQRLLEQLDQLAPHSRSVEIEEWQYKQTAEEGVKLLLATDYSRVVPVRWLQLKFRKWYLSHVNDQLSRLLFRCRVSRTTQ